MDYYKIIKDKGCARNIRSKNQCILHPNILSISKRRT